MRNHTTYTELRRIMKLKNDGMTVEQISNETFISQAEVTRVIEARTPKKKKAAKKAPETTE